MTPDVSGTSLSNVVCVREACKIKGVAMEPTNDGHNGQVPVLREPSPEMPAEAVRAQKMMSLVRLDIARFLMAKPESTIGEVMKRRASAATAPRRVCARSKTSATWWSTRPANDAATTAATRSTGRRSWPPSTSCSSTRSADRPPHGSTARRPPHTSSRSPHIGEARSVPSPTRGALRSLEWTNPRRNLPRRTSMRCEVPAAPPSS